MRANAGAVFSPDSSAATGDYGASGTWRFDNVTVNATAIPEPTSMVVLGAASVLGLAVRRYRRNAAAASLSA